MIDEDHHGMSNRGWDDSQQVSAFCQILADGFRDFFVDLQFTTSYEGGVAIGVGIERILVMVHLEARSRHGFSRGHTEFDMIEQHVQSRLILDVSAGHADRYHWQAILQHEGWRQRDSRAFARLDSIRMIGICIHTSHAVSRVDS